MSSSLSPDARSAPAVARNRDPILAALQPRLPGAGRVLEIAAGTGEHAVFFAAALPHLLWQPTDPDPASLASIAAWRSHAALPNLLAPLPLDAARPQAWPVAQAEAIVSINMIHISPWAATAGLMRGAGRLLPAGGKLFLYGPFLEPGVETAPSNLAFDAELKARDAAWGLRHRDEVAACAAPHQLELVERLALPANNLILVFRRA